MSDHEILEELLAEKRMRDRWRRIKLAIAAVILVLLIILACMIVPKAVAAYRTYTETMARINTVVDQVESTMSEVQSSFDELDSSISDIRSSIESTIDTLTEQLSGLADLSETLKGLGGLNIFRR